jgi:hypothetical protein
MLKKLSPHDELCLRAEHWLNQQGCKVVLRDPFRCSTNKEQPDAIGWRDGVSIVIEAKMSRSDFLSDKKKTFRKRPSYGMGDWRFYMCPPEIIQVKDLPAGWGLLWVTPKTVRKMHGVPPNTNWHRHKPFVGNKLNETCILTSALRRFAVRGLMETVYLPIGETL